MIAHPVKSTDSIRQATAPRTPRRRSYEFFISRLAALLIVFLGASIGSSEESTSDLIAALSSENANERSEAEQQLLRGDDIVWSDCREALARSRDPEAKARLEEICKHFMERSVRKRVLETWKERWYVSRSGSSAAGILHYAVRLDSVNSHEYIRFDISVESWPAKNSTNIEGGTVFLENDREMTPVRLSWYTVQDWHGQDDLRRNGFVFVPAFNPDAKTGFNALNCSSEKHIRIAGNECPFTLSYIVPFVLESCIANDQREVCMSVAHEFAPHASPSTIKLCDSKADRIVLSDESEAIAGMIFAEQVEHEDAWKFSLDESHVIRKATWMKTTYLMCSSQLADSERHARRSVGSEGK